MNEEKESDLLSSSVESEEEDDGEQLSLPGDFELQEAWEEEWQDMPEFIQEDLMPWRTLYVHFENIEGVNKFSKLVEQKLTDATKYIWYPEVEPIKASDYRYTDE